MNRAEITTIFKQMQDEICNKISLADGEASFVEELWQHTEEGGGRTRILQKGRILEKAGVNFSAVSGNLNNNMMEALSLQSAGFFATGVSIVMHPSNPWVPIIHMNVRYFETEAGYWFGGGIDLTPHYIDEGDARFFHQSLKNVCDQYDPSAYEQFKHNADEYFYNPHRSETRGIGGIFFDRLNEKSTGHSKNEIWDFVQAVGFAFPDIYSTLMLKNANLPYTEREKHWQQLRRGRYVEFNLVYDKGTKFGFETSGRTESILMSLPPLAAWDYKPEIAANSREERTLALLKKGHSWL